MPHVPGQKYVEGDYNALWLTLYVKLWHQWARTVLIVERGIAPAERLRQQDLYRWELSKKSPLIPSMSLSLWHDNRIFTQRAEQFWKQMPRDETIPFCWSAWWDWGDHWNEGDDQQALIPTIVLFMAKHFDEVMLTSSIMIIMQVTWLTCCHHAMSSW